MQHENHTDEHAVHTMVNDMHPANHGILNNWRTYFGRRKALPNDLAPHKRS